MDDFDDGLIEEDDALDYVLFEEMEKERKNDNSNTGCLGLMIVFGGVLSSMAFAAGFIL